MTNKDDGFPYAAPATPGNFAHKGPAQCPADAKWMGPNREYHEGPPPDLDDWTPMNLAAREYRDAATAYPTTCRVEWLRRENSAQSGWYVWRGDKRVSGPWSYEGPAQMWALGYDAALHHASLTGTKLAQRPAPQKASR